MLRKSLVGVISCIILNFVFFGISRAGECIWSEQFENAKPSDGKIFGRLVEGKTGKGFLVQNKQTGLAYGDYAVFDSKGKLNVNEGTIDLWVKPNFDGGDKTERTIFDILGTPSHWNRFCIGIHSTGYLMFDIVSDKNSVEDIWNADCYLLGNISGWKKGEWHRITATWQNVNSGEANGVIQLFLDGKKSGDRRSKITITETGKEIFIGSPAVEFGRGGLWNGVIDEVAIYNYVKTE